MTYRSERLRIRDKAYAVLERQHADQMSETTYLKAQLEQLSALLASTRREAASQVESALSTPRKEDSQRLHETLAEIEALRLASRLHEEKADEFRSQVCRLDGISFVGCRMEDALISYDTYRGAHCC